MKEAKMLSGAALKGGLSFFFLSFIFMQSYAQSLCTTNSNLTNFGVDGDFYSNTTFSNSDDWFSATGGTGVGVIGTTAATNSRNVSAATFKAVLQAAGSVTGRNITYEQRMAYPTFTQLNGQLLLDALAARDNFATQGALDSTMISNTVSLGSNPTTWTIANGQVSTKTE